ncbi:hypothetical protein [Polaribacter sp. HL-MS24]|uniref:hypothetical protein n=1 Tax=Polaribacter sp. HL-MS24 TaxID=3077735 RepID=UPI0029350B4F|nr:hypothetical protein [Polaribacter sp. HL-MS24]WOC40132.1 hypothetical protein RRF69_11060 [Polaribacter sp. HL-MS24]
MKKSKKIQFFLKKHFYKFRILTITLGTLIMFYGLYFSDKPATIKTIIENKKNPMMYLCILFSFAGSLFINYIIGGFNKENVRKMTSKKEFKD